MKYLAYFFIPFVISLILTPVVRVFAVRRGVISFPRSDRWHKHPTALLGGIGIYLAVVVPVLFFCDIRDRHLQGLLLGATLLFIVGLIDDLVHLRPYTKLFAQIIAGCIVLFSGVILGLPLHIAVAMPLTLLWIVGITNSFNLLDNIDGLAAGIAAICSFMLFSSLVIFANNPLGALCLILSGAALGFLPYNFNPAKIFMGDSGSMFLGFTLAVISIAGTSRHVSNLLITILIPVLILSVPIFDTIFVMLGRKLQGRRIFEGGRDHTSHRLVTLGLSQRRTVLLIYTISALFGYIAILFSQLNAFVILIIAFLAIVILLFFGLFLFEGTSYSDKLKAYRARNPAQNNKTVVANAFLHKRRMVEVLLDFMFICIAYYAAYFLRFEGHLLAVNIYLIRESLPWLILIKMSIFFGFGLYRGVWRYASISDLLTIFKVVSLGSIASILFLTFAFRFRDYSRAVFFIDWLLLLFLVCGSRVLFRVLGECFSRIKEKGARNVLIVGAGDTGEMVMREIKRNKALDYNPIGFIDDDPSKVGNKIQGIPVLGTRARIKALVESEQIQEVIIAIPSMEEEGFADIIAICNEIGVPYKKVKGILDE